MMQEKKLQLKKSINLMLFRISLMPIGIKSAKRSLLKFQIPSNEKNPNKNLQVMTTKGHNQKEKLSNKLKSLKNIVKKSSQITLILSKNNSLSTKYHLTSSRQS
jgi:hypothetical protein